MGLAVLALFLLAWAVVLGGPILARYLRSREANGDDPLRDPFAALGRSVERSGELEPQPRRRRRDARPDPDFDVPTAPIPRLDVPLEPRVVSLAADGPVPSEVRRQRTVLALVAGAFVLLLLAIATGSVVLWGLQLLVDALFVAYTVALVRHARPRPARDRDDSLGHESIRELLLRSRRFVVPAVAVVAVGAIVFGGVVLAGSGDDHPNDRAGAVEGSQGSDTVTSDAVRTPRTTTGITVPDAPPPPPTTAAPVTTPATSPATTRATFPARTLPPVTMAAPVVPAVVPPPGTTPAAPAATQPPNLLCVLLHAFC